MSFGCSFLLKLRLFVLHPTDGSTSVADAGTADCPVGRRHPRLYVRLSSPPKQVLRRRLWWARLSNDIFLIYHWRILWKWRASQVLLLIETEDDFFGQSRRDGAFHRNISVSNVLLSELFKKSICRGTKWLLMIINTCTHACTCTCMCISHPLIYHFRYVLPEYPESKLFLIKI